MYEYREIPMLNIHEELDRLLRRTEAAEYVTDTYGIPCSPKTLAKLVRIQFAPTYVRLILRDPFCLTAPRKRPYVIDPISWITPIGLC